MFKEVAENKRSKNMKSIVYGVGINDANYKVQIIVNGKPVNCPYYVKWKAMIERCYSSLCQERYPSYIGCSVCNDWLLFSNFKRWMKGSDWHGMHLDKDVLVQGNKIYSPETCIFVSRSVNQLLTNHGAKRGKYPQGVSFNKRTKKYVAKVKREGREVYIGSFGTPSDAHDEYKKAKYEIIKDVALNQTEPLRSALLNYKIK